MEYGISLGSNLGDRLALLTWARRELARLPETRILAASPVYETEPVDMANPENEPWFLNAVLILDSSLPPREMANTLHAIEAEAGRIRSASRNSARTLDLDMIYAGDLHASTPDLTLPHPRWHTRRFVVQPLADVRPELSLPGQSRTVHALLLSLPQTPNVIPFTGNDWETPHVSPEGGQA